MPPPGAAAHQLLGHATPRRGAPRPRCGNKATRGKGSRRARAHPLRRLGSRPRETAPIKWRLGKRGERIAKYSAAHLVTAAARARTHKAVSGTPYRAGAAYATGRLRRPTQVYLPSPRRAVLEAQDYAECYVSYGLNAEDFGCINCRAERPGSPARCRALLPPPTWPQLRMRNWKVTRAMVHVDPHATEKNQ
eukprot:1923629-Prymnesium_polylepis.2